MLLEIGAHSRSKLTVVWLQAKANFLSKLSLKEARLKVTFRSNIKVFQKSWVKHIP